MKLGLLRKMRLINLIVCLAFCLNMGFSGSALAFGRAQGISEEASMLRQRAASESAERAVLSIGIDALRETLRKEGPNGLKKRLADSVLDGRADALEKGFVEGNIGVLEREGRTYIVSLLGNGWRVDLSQGDLEVTYFKSTEERDAFISGGQLTWIAGEYTPAQLIDAQQGAKEYLTQAGAQGRIFTEEGLPEQVAAYSASRAARKLPPLSPKEQEALVERLRAAFAFHNGAINSLTQERVDAMMAIGLPADAGIKIGAEDFSLQAGAAVGTTTLDHLQEAGVNDSIVGHSATRFTGGMFDGKDTHGVITAKLRAALANKIKVTFCVGEDLPTRQKVGFQDPLKFVLSQLEVELGALNLTGEQVLGLLEAVAYEPIWAIGTGKNATPEQIQEMHAAIRGWFKDKYGEEVANQIVIKYGGSVSAKNAAEIFALPDVDGALIGGASLKAEPFAEIVGIADAAGEKKGKTMHVSANWKAEDRTRRDDLAAHLSVLTGVSLNNVAVNYYLPFTLLAGAQDLLNKSRSLPVAEVKQDLSGVRQALVLDEEGNPSFFHAGEAGTSREFAVTASSGGFRYAGYAGERGARSVYTPLAMVDSFEQMAAGDLQALAAYQAKLLHEFFEVSADSKSHRQESPAVVASINKYDQMALGMWKKREADKATARLLGQENKKSIAEATSANIGKFLPGGAITSELIDVANAQLQELVNAGLLTGHRVAVKDGAMHIYTTRQNSKATEESAKIPSAILGVYLKVLSAARERGIYVGEDLTGRSYRYQRKALGISVPLPTLTYLAPEGWAESIFGSRVRTALTVPEGQAKGFFTNDYHAYRIDGLLAKPLEQVPDAVVNAVRIKLGQDIAQGKILSAVVNDFGGTDIDIQVTHRYGEQNAALQRIILEAMREGVLKAQQLGLLRQDVNVASMSLADLAKALRVKYAAHSITERGAEPVVVAKIVGAGIGASNVKLYHEFFMPGSTPLQKLGFTPTGKAGVRGFRAIVRRTEDVLRGNLNGPVWEFEKSAAFTDASGKEYPSVDQTLELLALASQPNDFLITAVYTVEGSALTSNEPVVTVVFQPVYGEEGGLRSLNPTFINRSQSGADAVGGVASMFYDANFVPGGPNGENYVATRPATLKEARRSPKKGTAHVVIYGWQSKGNGVIPTEEGGIVDHVAINPPALQYERRLADKLASVMTTHEHDQPYVAPFATQERVEPQRKAQAHLFERAPKEADIDPRMDEVEEKVASGQFLSVTDDKADMGGKWGHNFTPEYMLAIDRATVLEAMENGTLSDGNIVGFTDYGRLKGTTPSVGDDSHVLMLGDISRNSAESHQLAFLAFTRGYYAAVVNGEKPYGLAQDYQGKEAKAAKTNPIFYSHFTPRFFEILRQVMPLDYMGMVDKMEEGWKKWQETSATVTLPEPFSGNVSQQGIGSARYLVDVAGGERTFGMLAGDKMGPAALNRPIREGVYAALAAGKFENGLVFEIWDAKAFDEHGNIPVDELPDLFADVADAITSLNETDQAFARELYEDGVRLNAVLLGSDRIRLAQLLKQAGYVPTKRIYLDSQADREAIYLYLADSDRFNIKTVWGKKKPGWDINRPQDYLDRPMLGSSVTKLGILAGGEYIGKDDPVMVGHILLMEHIWEFLRVNPLIIQGDMNGSHWLGAIPTAFKNAVASKESHPILVGLRYTLSDDGKELAKVEDVFSGRSYDAIRAKMFEFDFEFKRAALGGQFEPYGTNWRTVEASYPLAKLLKALQAPNSPFLVSNKPAAERRTRPIGLSSGVVDVFDTATGSVSVPSAPEGWVGTDEEAQRFLQSALALQSSGLSHKISDAVIGVAKDSANQRVVLISASVLRSDPSLIFALQSINTQINQNLGVFGSNANIDANAYRFVLVADVPALRTAQDMERLFTAIAKATDNGVRASKDIFAQILTQEDMYEGAISDAASLLRQLKRMGVSEDSLVAFVGPGNWTRGLKQQDGVSSDAFTVNVEAKANEVAFAANALFGVVEAVAAPDRALAPSQSQELELVQAASSIAVESKGISGSVADTLDEYRRQLEAEIRV